MILAFPKNRLRVVLVLRRSYWTVLAPDRIADLFADRGDARRFAQRVAANLNLQVRELRA